MKIALPLWSNYRWVLEFIQVEHDFLLQKRHYQVLGMYLLHMGHLISFSCMNCSAVFGNSLISNNFGSYTLSSCTNIRWTSSLSLDHSQVRIIEVALSVPTALMTSLTFFINLLVFLISSSVISNRTKSSTRDLTAFFLPFYLVTCPFKVLCAFLIARAVRSGKS